MTGNGVGGGDGSGGGPTIGAAAHLGRRLDAVSLWGWARRMILEEEDGWRMCSVTVRQRQWESWS